MKTIILGAGITGLAAGIKTGATIYEAKDVPGGICRSYHKNGYFFEVGGGHWIFGGDVDSMTFINSQCDLDEYTRKAGVYINKIYPYPIQAELSKDSVESRDSLKAWNHNNFSRELCNLFFDPFNEKYTAGLYDSIIQENEQKSPKSGKGYNDTFYYPTLGLDNLIDQIASKCDIRFNKEVVRIDTGTKVVTFSDGKTVRYDRLISTLPLDRTLQMCELFEYLPYTSVKVLNIGAEKGKNCPDDHWLYIPHCKSGFYRVGFYSNVSNTFAPKGKVALYVEKAYVPDVDFDNPFYSKDVVEELQNWGFIGTADVVDENFIEYAYTWKFRNTRVENGLKHLKSKGIESIGRYGKWKFCGIVDSIKDGLSC